MKKILSFILFFFFITYSKCEYKLVWNDEFDGTTINITNWNVENTNVVYNNELEAYNTANVAVINGNLVITAKNTTYLNKKYQSGRINSLNKKMFSYGKFEARVKFPSGKGFWGAFWTMTLYDANNYGEMDIVEALCHQLTSTNATCFTGGPVTKMFSSTGPYVFSEDFSMDYHVFGVEWIPGELNFYIDGQTYFSCKNTTQGWTIDAKQFYIILNLAVGGEMAGPPLITTIFPNYMYVDWVRVYQDEQYKYVPPPVLPNGKTSCTSYTSATKKVTIRYLTTIGTVNTGIISKSTVIAIKDCCSLCGNTIFCIAFQTTLVLGKYTCILYKKV